MPKFKNLITETGSFLVGDVYHDFSNPFETEDKEVIAHLRSRSDFEEIKEGKKPTEGNKTPDDSLESKNKAELVKIAETLKIETKGLNKEQILEAIKLVKSGENGIDLNDIDLAAQEMEDLIALAESLNINIENLTEKDQLIKAIEDFKNKNEDL